MDNRGGKQKVRLVDMVHPDREPRVFSSHKELCDYFGFGQPWLSQRIRRGKMEYGGYRIEIVEE